MRDPDWLGAGINQSTPIRILRLSEVIRVTGLRKTALYELQSIGAFPVSVQLTPRSVGWVENEVQLWLAAKLADRPRAVVDDRG